MFGQRYTEAARRTIFFARFEASKLVSGFIDPEHLLLGLLQVDKTLASRLSLDEIRLAITREAYPSGEAISTSDDMQLSESAKAVPDRCSGRGGDVAGLGLQTARRFMRRALQAQ